MNRSKIIQHYKSFFDIEDMVLAENDHLMIDWAEDLVKNCIKPHVINAVCKHCGKAKSEHTTASGMCKDKFKFFEQTDL